MKPLLAALGLLLASNAVTAVAKVAVTATVATFPGGGQLTVVVHSSTAFTSATRPRAVGVRWHGKTYPLHRTKATRAGGTSRWQSAVRPALAATVGQRVAVRVTARGTRTYSVTVAQASGGGSQTGGGGGTQTGGTQTSGDSGGGTQAGGTGSDTQAGSGGTTQPTDPRTRFLTMFNNSGWDRPYTANTPQHEPFEDLYNFCANNGYRERFTNGFTGIDTFYQGTWALQGDPQTGVVQGYNVVEGIVVTTDQNGEQTTLYVDLSEQVPNTAYINQKEYTRVTPQAC